jgi:hypothetical protein
LTSAVDDGGDDGAAVASRRRDSIAVGVLCVVVVASRWLLRARAPDGPDSLGFVLGMSRRFDMELLQPHFPGYPVFVALGKALCWMGLSGLNAATAISSLAAGVSAWGLAVCARRLAGLRAAVPVVLLYLVAFQPWLLGSGALSDSLGAALAVAATAVMAQAPPRFGVSGFLAGLLLGTRMSYWPMVLSLCVLWWILGANARTRRGQGEGAPRARAGVGLVVGTLLWAIPFVVVVGVRELVALGSVHVMGHFGWWGGSVATQSNIFQRLSSFSRDLLFDGFAPSGWVLAAIASILAVTAVWANRRRARAGSAVALAPLLVMALPYGLWVFLAQNVLEQPRHLLPLVEGGLLLLGAFLAPRRGALAAIVLLAAGVSLPLIWQRAHLPPAAVQAADWVAQNDNPDETTIMADRSARFFAELQGFTVRKHAGLSEVIGDLSRFRRFPSTLWLTSEIDLHSGLGDDVPLPRNWDIEPGPRFCRDARIDRAQPCLGLVKLSYEPK